MPLRKLKCNHTIMFPWWKPRLVLPLLSLSCLFLQGCPNPSACIRPTLQEVSTPVMRQVMLVPLSEADYGITDRGRKDILINLEELRSSLEQCNITISTYNKTVLSGKK